VEGGFKKGTFYQRITLMAQSLPREASKTFRGSGTLRLTADDPALQRCTTQFFGVEGVTANGAPRMTPAEAVP
jgi:hypothetical protein